MFSPVDIDRNVKSVTYRELLLAALEHTSDPDGYAKTLLSSLVEEAEEHGALRPLAPLVADASPPRPRLAK